MRTSPEAESFLREEAYKRRMSLVSYLDHILFDGVYDPERDPVVTRRNGRGDMRSPPNHRSADQRRGVR